MEGKMFGKSIENYISNDPEENADNFDPKWDFLRELSTDEERYQAIRKRWGNPDIPDPSWNLTFRRVEDLRGECETPRNPPEKKRKERRRSRSCTSPYEKLMTNLERDYFVQYCKLMFRQKTEMQDMLQFLSCQSYFGLYDRMIRQNFQSQQDQQVISLLSNHYQQMRSFIGEKKENIEACKRYIKEVRVFFTFYQKINDNEVTLQMTDEQYEHTVETERMYSMYSRFYK